MPLNDAALHVMGNAFAAVATHVSIQNGAAEVSTARQAILWTPAANGDIAITVAELFAGPAGQALTGAGLWSALTGGTFYGTINITGDLAFNVDGQYTLNTLTLFGTAT